ncbi:MAG: hypothetical protein H6615_09290 [Ignavibacteria bacterium]|nr:hypothetical protein [Ignavibacteria bacterium]
MSNYKMRGSDLFDNRNSKIGTLRGNDIYDSRNSKISTLNNVKKEIDGAIGGVSLVAFWIIFVR